MWCPFLSHDLPFLNHLLQPQRFMYTRIIHNKDQVLSWKWVHVIKETINELIKEFSSERPVQHIKVEDTIKWQCRKHGIPAENIIFDLQDKDMNSLFASDKVIPSSGTSPDWRPSIWPLCCGAIASRLINEDKLLRCVMLSYMDLEHSTDIFIPFQCWPSNLDENKTTFVDQVLLILTHFRVKPHRFIASRIVQLDTYIPLASWSSNCSSDMKISGVLSMRLSRNFKHHFKLDLEPMMPDTRSKWKALTATSKPFNNRGRPAISGVWTTDPVSSLSLRTWFTVCLLIFIAQAMELVLRCPITATCSLTALWMNRQVILVGQRQQSVSVCTVHDDTAAWKCSGQVQ